MPRIQPQSNPTPEAQKLLDGVKAKLGKVPNLFSTMAHSPALLESYLQLSGNLGKGKLKGALREKLALAIGGLNHCDYCVSAHTALGKMQKITEQELEQNLHGKSSDPKDLSALTFARTIVKKQGNITDDDLDLVRKAGYSEEEILEIFGSVAQNLFTNYFNHIAGTEVDFPKVSSASVK